MYKNGDIFEGTFIDGDRTKYGVLTKRDKISGYKGEWNNNKMHGYGELVQSKITYRGGFDTNKKVRINFF